MANCNESAWLANLTADCAAIQRVGGVKSTIYVIALDDIAGMTVNSTTGIVSGLTIKTGGKLYRLEGKKFRNTAGTTFARSENGPNLRTQSVTFRAFVKTSQQRKAADAVLDMESVAIFVTTNGGDVKLYGYSAGEGLSMGLQVTDASESDGTAMTDDTSWGMTFTGAEVNFPLLYQETGGATATLTYLDGLVTA